MRHRRGVAGNLSASSSVDVSNKKSLTKTQAGAAADRGGERDRRSSWRSRSSGERSFSPSRPTRPGVSGTVRFSRSMAYFAA